MTASFADGVTIKVNGSPVEVSAAEQQVDHAIIYYTISPAVQAGDTVTWEYAQASGGIVSEADGAPLEDVSAQAVTNNVAPSGPVPLLDLEADQLVLGDGDPVALWADQSGNGHDFTQTGAARPTKQTVSGYATIRFDGVDDFMEGQNWIVFDNLPSFTIFVIATTSDADNLNGHVIYKMTSLNDVPPSAIGWGAGAWGYTIDVEQLTNQGAYNAPYIYPISTPGNRHVCALQVRDWNADVTIYADGDNSQTQANTGAPSVVTSISNSVTLRLGTTNTPADDGYATMDLYCVRFYAPAPDDSDRAAIEAELAARYGITL